jgi:ubiquinone/menaquinone biosynthesis C-methylase UbiE
MNYFAYATAAERYAKSRPYFHPMVIEKIKAFLRLETPLLQALDVACGTGQSTKALAAITKNVMGLDVSEEMLVYARADNPGITFIQSPAESLPFEDDRFDLMTVSLAFHWFDRKAFLLEASRVLKTRGWLVIYNNNFSAQMKENLEFDGFFKDEYLKRFPNPPRNNQPLSKDTYRALGFETVSSETYSNDIAFTPETLANYLMTQSNVIARLEQGSENAEDIYAYILNVVKPFFAEGTFVFKGTIDYLQKF